VRSSECGIEEKTKCGEPSGVSRRFKKRDSPQRTQRTRRKTEEKRLTTEDTESTEKRRVEL
jgi:hypothetical protein